MMYRNTVLLVLILALLVGCNLPNRGRASTPSADPVATQVSLLLTQMPTATLAPSATLPPPPTETTSPTATTAAPQAPTATIAVPTPLPSVTPPSGDPRSSLGEPTWRNTLDSGKAFYLYENDNTKVTIDNGALALTGINADGWLGWSLTFSKPALNFYLEAAFIPQACSGADMYGLVFRSTTTESGYFFGVTCDGRYNLHARNFTDGTDIILAELTASSAIQTGSNNPNRLGVMATGDKIALYANGTLLEEFTDTRYQKTGNFGALVAANETAGFTAKMDEIALWVLP
jgi:hypothetical protein